MNEKERSAGRDDGGEHAVWDAEQSLSVTAAPFRRPVSPSLSHLMSLLKPRPPSEATPSRPRDYHCDPRAPPGPVPPFTRDPVPYSICLFPPPSSTYTNTQQRTSLSWGGQGVAHSLHQSGKRAVEIGAELQAFSKKAIFQGVLGASF